MSGGCHEEQSFIVMGHYAIAFRLFFKNFSPGSKVLGFKADIKTNSHIRYICHNNKLSISMQNSGHTVTGLTGNLADLKGR
jgi:membrane-bound inhibitor of C-type lysozyme